MPLTLQTAVQTPATPIRVQLCGGTATYLKTREGTVEAVVRSWIEYVMPLFGMVAVVSTLCVITLCPV